MHWNRYPDPVKRFYGAHLRYHRPLAMKLEIIDVAENGDGYLIQEIEETLTDGSFVYNIIIEDKDNMIQLNCRDKNHADYVFMCLANI
jgi:hypothetical protein